MHRIISQDQWLWLGGLGLSSVRDLGLGFVEEGQPCMAYCCGLFA